MKSKEIIGYILGYCMAFILTSKLIVDFDSNNIMAWVFAIPIIGFDVLLTTHLIKRVKEND